MSGRGGWLGRCLSHRRDLGHGHVRRRRPGEACDVAADGAVEAVVDAVEVQQGVEVRAGDHGAGVGGEACGTRRPGLGSVGEAGRKFGYPVGPVLLAHPAGAFEQAHAV
jgi:hypothetical protein